MCACRLALEIGGTKLQAALGTAEGEIVARERGAAPAGGAAAILGWFDEAVPRLLEKGGPTDIVVGFGGPVEHGAGRVLKSHQVGGWDDYPLQTHFEERFGLATSIYNDSSAAGWGEYRRGSGQGTRNFCYVNSGSGIGGAIILDGKLYDGQGLGAGEWGHTWIPDWCAEQPGAAVRLEERCSGWAIERRLRTATIPGESLLLECCGGTQARLTCAMLGEAAAQGDAFAVAEMEHIANALGIAFANLIALFHPERIAFGGGISLIGAPLFAPLRSATTGYAFGPYRGRYEIVPSQLGEDIVLVGALLLPG